MTTRKASLRRGYESAFREETGMLKENLIMLRKLNGYSQEQVAEKIGISRQAYAKWENGMTIPDIEKASLLAQVYGITIDGLIKTENVDGIGMLPPAPEGKNIWGVVTLGDRGQIVIPKAARDHLGINGGDRLIVASDEVGIALIPSDYFESKLRELADMISMEAEGN